MSERGRQDFQDEANKIATKANIEIKVLDGKARNVKKQPMHIPRSTPGPLRDAPATGRSDALRRMWETEWKAREDIAAVVDGMPATFHQDRHRVWDEASHILEGKPLVKESPGNFFDRTVSPYFNYRAAKEGDDLPGHGKGLPASPAASPSKFFEWLDYAPPSPNKVQETVRTKEVPKQAGVPHSKFFEWLEAPPSSQDKARDVSTGKDVSPQPHAQQSKFFTWLNDAPASPDKVPDVTPEKEPLPQANIQQSKFFEWLNHAPSPSGKGQNRDMAKTPSRPDKPKARGADLEK